MGLINIKQKSVKGTGIYISGSSVDLDYVHIYDHQVSESDWVNAAGVFARDAKKINISIRVFTIMMYKMEMVQASVYFGLKSYL